MFDENNKLGEETERHFGVFFPTKEPKYNLNFDTSAGYNTTNTLNTDM
nr:beta-1,3-glucanase [Prunus persica]